MQEGYDMDCSNTEGAYDFKTKEMIHTSKSELPAVADA